MTISTIMPKVQAVMAQWLDTVRRDIASTRDVGDDDVSIEYDGRWYIVVAPQDDRDCISGVGDTLVEAHDHLATLVQVTASWKSWLDGLDSGDDLGAADPDYTPCSCVGWIPERACPERDPDPNCPTCHGEGRRIWGV